MRCVTRGNRGVPKVYDPIGGGGKCLPAPLPHPQASVTSMYQVTLYILSTLLEPSRAPGAALGTVSHCAERSEAARTITGFRSLWLINDWPWSSKQ